MIIDVYVLDMGGIPPDKRHSLPPENITERSSSRLLQRRISTLVDEDAQLLPGSLQYA